MFQIISLIVIAALTVADRITKIAVVRTIKVTGPVDVIPGVLRLNYTENTGAAFSIFSDNTAALTLFTILVIVLCLAVLLMRKTKSKFASACLILIISGGIGNEIDRIAQGFVVDFIEPLFVDFAVFNFADICITVGAFLLVGYEIYGMITERRQNRNKKDD